MPVPATVIEPELATETTPMLPPRASIPVLSLSVMVPLLPTETAVWTLLSDPDVPFEA